MNKIRWGRYVVSVPVVCDNCGKILRTRLGRANHLCLYCERKKNEVC